MFIYDDNFLNEFTINEIENIFKSNDNRWGYSPTTLEQDYYNYNEIIHTEEFSDTQYFHMSPDPGSRALEFANIVVNEFTKKHGIKNFNISRIRFNVTPTVDKSFVTRPHVDWSEPHLVLLYYVNNSNGDTIIYDQKYDGSNITETSIFKQISPKRGSAFIIDGSHYHSLVVPQNGDLRKVINFNLTIVS